MCELKGIESFHGFKTESKQEELEVAMDHKDISIAAFCETNFVSNDDLPIFKGYRSYSANSSKPKSGVIIYVKEKFIEEYGTPTKYHSGLKNEYVLLCFDQLKFVCMYRHPNSHMSEFEQRLQEILRKIKLKKNDKIIFCGDMNFGDFEWKVFNKGEYYASTSGNKRKFEEFLENLKESTGLPMKQIVTKPTRKGKILDIVLTNFPEECKIRRVEKCYVKAARKCDSDHNRILGSFEI